MLVAWVLSVIYMLKAIEGNETKKYVEQEVERLVADTLQRYVMILVQLEYWEEAFP